MHVDLNSSLISQADYKLSPNHNDRPAGANVNLLVIHGISLPPGQFGGNWVHELFFNQLDPSQHAYFKEIAHLKVSSHLYIDREGNLWQFVPFNKRAWHAGTSSFDGKENCNDYSIGIELEGTDETPYTAKQYDTLIKATNAIIKAYPAITSDRIVGHCDIAPERKTDPGSAFDWVKYKQSLEIMLDDKQIG